MRRNIFRAIIVVGFVFGVALGLMGINWITAASISCTLFLFFLVGALYGMMAYEEKLR